MAFIMTSAYVNKGSRLLLRTGSIRRASTSSIESSLFDPKDQRDKSEDRYIANHRFWLRNVDFQLPNVRLSHEEVVNELCKALKPVKAAQFPSNEDGPTTTLTTPLSDFGFILAPQMQLLLPIHDGVAQKQHAMRLPSSYFAPDASWATNGALRLLLCGFSRRAQHHTPADSDTASSDDENDASMGIELGTRPVDLERVAALTQWLPRLSQDLSLETLLGSEEFQGTPPARIARSFICPRANRTHLPIPLDRKAKQAAEQIALAVRRLRADRAEYLRNVDRPAPLLDPAALKQDQNQQNEDKQDQNQSAVVAPHDVVLVLDNLRSAFNVGSLFRTAETAGLRGVVTAGITPHPPLCEKLRKTGFQAVDSVPTQHFDDVLGAVQALKARGFFVVALETTQNATRYDRLQYRRHLPLAVVVGNEVCGVDARVLQSADAVAQIPTFGQKNSLNVAAAAPIMLFEVLRQLNCDSDTDSSTDDQQQQQQQKPV